MVERKEHLDWGLTLPAKMLWDSGLKEVSF